MRADDLILTDDVALVVIESERGVQVQHYPWNKDVEDKFDNLSRTIDGIHARATLVRVHYGRDGVTAVARSKLLPVRGDGKDLAVRLGKGPIDPEDLSVDA